MRDEIRLHVGKQNRMGWFWRSDKASGSWNVWLSVLKYLYRVNQVKAS
jgi:hypothetical protein